MFPSHLNTFFPHLIIFLLLEFIYTFRSDLFYSCLLNSSSDLGQHISINVGQYFP